MTTTSPTLPPAALLAQYGIWQPAADSTKLRDAADAWKAVSTALGTIDEGLGKVASTIDSANQGQAADAFSTWWQQWSSGSGYLPTATAYCLSLSVALNGFADDVDQANQALQEAGEWFAVALAAATTPSAQQNVVSEMQTQAASIGGQLASAGQTRLAQSGVTDIQAQAVQELGQLRSVALTANTAPNLGTVPDFSSLLHWLPDFGALAGLATAGAAAGTSLSSSLSSPSGSSTASGGGATVTVTSPDGTVTTVSGTVTSPVTINAGGETITISPPSTAASSSSSVDPGLAAAAVAPLAGSALASSVGPGTTPAKSAFDTPVLTDAAKPLATPIPGTTPTPAATAPIDHLAAATTKIPTGVAGNTKGSGGVPFVPFGGMGAGAGGGDGDKDEGPTRRRTL